MVIKGVIDVNWEKAGFDTELVHSFLVSLHQRIAPRPFKVPVLTKGDSIIREMPLRVLSLEREGPPGRYVVGGELLSSDGKKIPVNGAIEVDAPRVDISDKCRQSCEEPASKGSHKPLRTIPRKSNGVLDPGQGPFEHS